MLCNAPVYPKTSLHDQYPPTNTYLTHGSLHNWNKHNGEEEDWCNGDVTPADTRISKQSSGA